MFFRRVPSGCRSPSAAGARKKTRSAYTGRDKRGAESMPCVNVFAPSSADTHANPRSLINRANAAIKNALFESATKVIRENYDSSPRYIFLEYSKNISIEAHKKIDNPQNTRHFNYSINLDKLLLKTLFRRGHDMDISCTVKSQRSQLRIILFVQ